MYEDDDSIKSGQAQAYWQSLDEAKRKAEVMAILNFGGNQTPQDRMNQAMLYVLQEVYQRNRGYYFDDEPIEKEMQLSCRVVDERTLQISQGDVFAADIAIPHDAREFDEVKFLPPDRIKSANYLIPVLHWVRYRNNRRRWQGNLLNAGAGTSARLMEQIAPVDMQVKSGTINAHAGLLTAFAASPQLKQEFDNQVYLTVQLADGRTQTRTQPHGPVQFMLTAIGYDKPLPLQQALEKLID